MCLFLMLSVAPAGADEVELPGYTKLTYPESVKLKKNGCQKINVSYETEEALSRENTFFLIAIKPKTSKRSVGSAAWFATLTHMGDKALPAMSRIGALQVKVCRKAWLFSANATKLTRSVKPGSYRIFFIGGTIDPATGATMQEKVEIIRSISFT